MNTSVTFGLIKANALGGTTGGQLVLAKPPTGSTLANDVVMDVSNNVLRVYENATPFRGITVDLTAAGSQSSLWHNGNFNPADKANVAGQTFAGGIYVRASGTTGYSGLQTGDTATRSGFVEFRNGSGVRHGYIGYGDGTTIPINAETGYWNFLGNAPRINGQTIWNAGNFDPGTKANLASPAFTGSVTAPFYYLTGSTGNNWLTAGNGDSATYATHNVKMRIHWGLGMESYDGTVNGFWDSRAGVWDTKGVPRVNGSNVWYPGNFDPNTKANLAGANFTGDITTTGRLVTGVGQTSSWVEMRDTDESTRFIHNNSTTIGFVGADGGWKFRVYDTGAVWTAQLGDLNTAIVDRANSAAGGRVAKTGDSMTGELIITKGDGQVRLADAGNNGQWRLNAYSDQKFYIQDWFQGAFRSNPVIISRDGAISTAQLGDLNTRIEDRAYAWAADRAGYRVAKTGDTMTGDLSITKTYPSLHMLYPGVRDIGWQTRENGQLYLWDWTGNTWQARFDLGGTIVARGSVCSGDGSATLATNGDVYGSVYGNKWLSTRLSEIDSNANNRIARAGDSFKGRMTVDNGAGAILDFLRGGIMRWEVRCWTNAELQFLNSDNGAVYQNFRTDGSIWTSMYGNLHDYIANSINNKSVRLAYAGDLGNDWNNGGGYEEPYGGGVLTSRIIVPTAAGIMWGGGRWRYLQCSTAAGVWFTVGYV